jgi:hypothetical protein
MYITRNFIRIHKVNIAIVLFLIIFTVIHMTKPAILYNEDGSYRPFGLGYKNKTVVPIWVVAIILAILCYMSVLYCWMFCFWKWSEKLRKGIE